MEKVEKVEKMKKAEISEKTKKVGVTEKKERVDKNVSLYQQRLARHLDELKWLYMELYDSQEHFDDLLKHLEHNKKLYQVYFLAQLRSEEHTS